MERKNAKEIVKSKHVEKKKKIPDDTSSEDDSESGSKTSSSSSHHHIPKKHKTSRRSRSSMKKHEKVPAQEISDQESDESVPQVSAPQDSQDRPSKEPEPVYIVTIFAFCCTSFKTYIIIFFLYSVLRLSSRPQEADPVFVAEDVVAVALGLVWLMKGRAALWDKYDQNHAKREYCRALWMEVYTWEDLSTHEQWIGGDRIKNHWHSIRDPHMRDLREEEQRPSGTGASHKTPYVHRPLLGFLQKCHEMRKTQSSVNMAPLPPPGPSSPPSQPLPGPSPDTADQGQDSK
ncbi:uncharacterized protein LOC130274528 [Hyla sarda]|uniref:uncharacterized protein LOC130274528 n=1 Tax=Hyla sarda TaxID=327740 RepID=UPI0024C3C871|nr:uncharacterized protein LOC130274528 [Hyla sarda]